MKQTLILSFILGATIQAFIAGFFGKLEVISITPSQQITASGMLILIASAVGLAGLLFNQSVFMVQAIELAGMATQALVSSILIKAGVTEFASYHFQLSLGAAYFVVLIALGWEWFDELRLP